MQTVLVVWAEHRKTGRKVPINSYTAEDAGTDKPLAYCANMEKRCKSHRNFTLRAESWEDAVERERRIDHAQTHK